MFHKLIALIHNGIRSPHFSYPIDKEQNDEIVKILRFCLFLRFSKQFG